MRPDRSADAPGRRGFTVVEILVVLLLLALAIWLVRTGYHALTHHALERPGSVRLAVARPAAAPPRPASLVRAPWPAAAALAPRVPGSWTPRRDRSSRP